MVYWRVLSVVLVRLTTQVFDSQGVWDMGTGVIGDPVSAPKFAEAIPAVTRPVALPRLVPGRARMLADVITGGVLLAVNTGLLIFAAVTL